MPRPVLLLALVLAGSAAGANAQDEREARQRCRDRLKTAVQACAEGRPAEALPVLDEVLGCDPDSPDAFYWQGRAHLALGDTAAAAGALTEGTAAAPLSSQLKLLLARVRLGQGRSEEAAALAGTVLAVKPREGEALYLRGLARLAAGDTTAALADWSLSLDAALREGRR